MAWTLITSIGTSGYTEVEYNFKEGLCRTPYPAVALCKITEKPPERVLVFITEKANAANGDKYRVALKEAAGVEPEILVIPEGKNETELVKILGQVIDAMEAAPDGMDMALDVTFSFRSLQFIFFAAAFYLTSQKRLRLKGIYYGAYELDKPRAALIDLSRLIRIIDWYYAVRGFRETGSLAGLSRTLGRIAADFAKAGGDLGAVSAIRKSVDALVFPLENAMVLEAGILAKSRSANLDRLSQPNIMETLPELRPIIKDLADIFSWLGVPESGPKTKTSIPLEEGELDRELRFMEFYLDHSRVQECSLLMREWLINLVLWVKQEEQWLDHEIRHQESELPLGYWCRLLTSKNGPGAVQLSQFQIELAKIFTRVGEIRNHFAHLAFGEKNFSDPIQKLREIFDQLKTIKVQAKGMRPEQLDQPRPLQGQRNDPPDNLAQPED